ncbi:hypothetical protein BDK51DRAFT_27995 [Blyttiomyces helicus]|uniref:Uncharacterized protein n=1 Tax=Blyttiomyces helicus TaxID=388810 RepID=A0A4P9WG59_9FUNG|nr:hypothetical protein BDK51DRAFT_27995 [Blyttiomyces helicus]|eukprot:RKO91322.1 hypothetical protein BDK51DRAFT_27995 [Blyttiomyces helicus]
MVRINAFAVSVLALGSITTVNSAPASKIASPIFRPDDTQFNVTISPTTSSPSSDGGSGKATFFDTGNFNFTDSVNATFIDTGNGTFIDTGNGTFIDTGNGTFIDTGNATFVDPSNSTIMPLVHPLADTGSSGPRPPFVTAPGAKPTDTHPSPSRVPTTAAPNRPGPVSTPTPDHPSSPTHGSSAPKAPVASHVVSPAKTTVPIAKPDVKKPTPTVAPGKAVPIPDRKKPTPTVAPGKVVPNPDGQKPSPTVAAGAKGEPVPTSDPKKSSPTAAAGAKGKALSTPPPAPVKGKASHP